MTNLQIRIDADLKAEAQSIANALGMDLTTAVKIFLRQMVADRALPFKPSLDPFYSNANQKALKHSIEQLNSGVLVHKTMDELNKLAQ